MSSSFGATFVGSAQSKPGIKVLLACGVLSSLLYLVMNVVVAAQYKGYNSASQTVSELSAIDAPTRQLWVLLGIPYTAMLLAFGWGVWVSAAGSRALRFIGAAILAQGLINPFWPPMHQREALVAGGGDIRDTLHIAFTAVWGALSIFQLICGAVALGRRFGIYSIVTLVILLAFGLWTGVESPRLEAGLQTPWIGLAERVNIGAYMLWVAILAICLMASPATLRKGHS